MDINHFRMAYDSQGSGTPLLLIHGYPLNRQIWDAQRQSLASVLHLITPDLRGFGESGATPGPYSMDMLADDCAALLAGLGISQPVVVGGLSMGGYVALAFARRHPDLLAGLLLISTRAAPDSPEGRANRDKSIALAQEKGVEAVTAAMLPETAGASNVHR